MSERSATPEEEVYIPDTRLSEDDGSSTSETPVLEPESHALGREPDEKRVTKKDPNVKCVPGTNIPIAVPSTPPVIRLPCCPLPYSSIEVSPISKEQVEVVTSVERCKTLVARLQRERLLAVAAVGVNVGREGPVTLVQLSTCAGHVFLFDVLLERELMGRGRLGVLLEDSNIVKVMHDCSHVSAAFSYQFAVTLTNVFDTQVAHLVIAEHKGRRLPSGLPLSDICLQYSDSAEKFYTFDWRTGSKRIWTGTIGNFWAHRPLTPDMVEFAASDVIVLIPDVYRYQSEYIEQNGLKCKMQLKVEEWLQMEIDEVTQETHGKRVSDTVLQILHEMDRKYHDHSALFNVLDPDEMNALSIVTYEDAESVSENILRLKIDAILADIEGIEVKLRTSEESWEHRRNILDYLRYYTKLPNEAVSSKADKALMEAIRLILEHMEDKYNVNTTPNMISLTERKALLTIPYKDFEQDRWGKVVSSLFWKFMQDEVHEMINFLRMYPSQFVISDEAYEKLEYFARNVASVPEEVSSLCSGLLHAIRYYNAETGSHVVDKKRALSAPPSRTQTV